MPGAQEIHNADTEISKRHVRNESLFLLPLCTGALDSVDLSQPQYLLSKTFSRFPYSSPFHLYILRDRNRVRKPKVVGVSFPLRFHFTFSVISHPRPFPDVDTSPPHTQIRSPCRCSRRKRTDFQEVRYHPTRWPCGRGRTG